MYLYLRLKKKLAIRKWYADLNLINHQRNFNKLYENVNGFTLSRQARAHNDAMEYTYGEIDFISFINSRLSTVLFFSVCSARNDSIDFFR